MGIDAARAPTCFLLLCASVRVLCSAHRRQYDVSPVWVLGERASEWGRIPRRTERNQNRFGAARVPCSASRAPHPLLRAICSTRHLTVPWELDETISLPAEGASVMVGVLHDLHPPAWHGGMSKPGVAVKPCRSTDNALLLGRVDGRALKPGDGTARLVVRPLRHDQAQCVARVKYLWPTQRSTRRASQTRQFIIWYSNGTDVTPVMCEGILECI